MTSSPTLTFPEYKDSPMSSTPSLTTNGSSLELTTDSENFTFTDHGDKSDTESISSTRGIYAPKSRPTSHLWDVDMEESPFSITAASISLGLQNAFGDVEQGASYLAPTAAWVPRQRTKSSISTWTSRTRTTITRAVRHQRNGVGEVVPPVPSLPTAGQSIPSNTDRNATAIAASSTTTTSAAQVKTPNRGGKLSSALTKRISTIFRKKDSGRKGKSIDTPDVPHRLRRSVSFSAYDSYEREDDGYLTDEEFPMRRPSQATILG